MKILGYLVALLGIASTLSIILMIVTFVFVALDESIPRESTQFIWDIEVKTFFYSIGFNVIFLCLGFSSDSRFLKDSTPWLTGLLLTVGAVLFVGCFTLIALILPHPP